MTILEIVREYLKANGYDGLCNPDAECGCVLDDLMPCSEPGMECQAGHRVKPGPDDDPDNEWLIVPGTKEHADDGAG
jgi:hypothetical protein